MYPGTKNLKYSTMKKALYILGLLDDKDLDWFAGSGKKKSLEIGQIIIQEGQPSLFLYLILSGTVSVSVKGRRVAEIGQGEVMGEISLLDSSPPSATLKAETPTELLAISFESLRAKLSRDAPFAARLYQALGTFLAQRLRVVNVQLIVGDAAKVDLADENKADEIDPEVLEKITLAGSRFRWILEKLGASKGVI